MTVAVPETETKPTSGSGFDDPEFCHLWCCNREIAVCGASIGHLPECKVNVVVRGTDFWCLSCGQMVCPTCMELSDRGCSCIDWTR